MSKSWVPQISFFHYIPDIKYLQFTRKRPSFSLTNSIQWTTSFNKDIFFLCVLLIKQKRNSKLHIQYARLFWSRNYSLKKTSHAFVLQSWSHPAFLNFKTAGIRPLAAVLQHPYEQQAVPLASTPSEEKKEVWMKRMNIHEIFMTVKVSRGTSVGLAFELNT